MEYLKYLKSEGWQKKRKRSNYWHKKQCAICKSKKIHIHHKTYRDLPNENVKYHLIPLCKEHHFGIHDYAKKNNLNLYHATEKFIKDYYSIKKIKKLTWKDLSPFQRELYLRDKVGL